MIRVFSWKDFFSLLLTWALVINDTQPNWKYYYDYNTMRLFKWEGFCLIQSRFWIAFDVATCLLILFCRIFFITRLADKDWVVGFIEELWVKRKGLIINRKFKGNFFPLNLTLINTISESGGLRIKSELQIEVFDAKIYNFRNQWNHCRKKSVLKREL